MKQKIEEDANYDAFCIFDADNIVDVNFLKNMNKKLCQGEDVVQGYRDIKILQITGLQQDMQYSIGQ